MRTVEINYVPCHFTNYQRNRVAQIQYIVIHYTGNDGDTDSSNAKYFQRPNIGASAHYFVDSDSITQSVKDQDIAWHCGTRNVYQHPKCRNTNSIGIEICDDVKNGKVYPSDKAVQNALRLTKWLMAKYNIPQKNVIRHYDVTGKQCPAYWVNESKWKNEFWNLLGDDELVEKSEMIVNGKSVQVERILKDGTNYVKIRDVANVLGLNISNKGSIPVLTSK